MIDSDFFKDRRRIWQYINQLMAPAYCLNDVSQFKNRSCHHLTPVGIASTILTSSPSPRNHFFRHLVCLNSVWKCTDRTNQSSSTQPVYDSTGELKRPVCNICNQSGFCQRVKWVNSVPSKNLMVRIRSLRLAERHVLCGPALFLRIKTWCWR